jgi:hypothetical protein
MAPYLIITAGATGSGKTDLIENTTAYLGLDRSTFHKMLIDDVVESDERYVATARKIVEEVGLHCEGNPECEEQAYLNPTAELFKQFEDAYYDSRRLPGCNGKEVSCDQSLNTELKDHFREGRNVIFETTGERMPGGWILEPDFMPSHYNVVIAYSLVGLDALVKRNKTRALSAVNQFKSSGYKGPAPRLANVSQARFVNVLTSIKKNLNDLYYSCVRSHDAKCGANKINQLLIFDNNETSTLVFDSLTDTEEKFNAIVSSAFPSVGGRKKKSYSARRFGKTKKRVSSSRTVSASQRARIGTRPRAVSLSPW